MEHAKMIKTAKGLDMLFKITQRIIAVVIPVMLVLMIALTIANAVNPGVVIGEDFHLVDLGGFTFELEPGHIPDNATVLRSAWIMAAFATLSAAAMWYAFAQLRKLLAPMKEGLPFCDATCEALGRLSWCAVIMGVIANIGAAVETASLMNIYQLRELLAGGAIVSISPNFTFELDFLVVFFVLQLVRYIFRYGTQLQQLSDETL